MKTLEQLYSGFYLCRETSNSQISNCQIPLRVAPIKTVTNHKNLEIDYNHFSFAEKDKNGKVEYFHGLKNFLLIKNLRYPPIFIFDNHNHAPVFRYNIMQNKKINNINLIHIDQHSDCRENKKHIELNLQKDETKKVFKFCNEECNVGNFIPPFIECGLITKQFQIRSTSALKNFNINNETNFILDIDLDFCLDGVNREKINKECIELLHNKFHDIGKHALGITIATSPYFLNQELAIKIVEELLSK